MPPSTERLFVLANIINSEKYKVLFSKPFTHLQTKKQNLPFPVGNLLSIRLKLEKITHTHSNFKVINPFLQVKRLIHPRLPLKAPLKYLRSAQTSTHSKFFKGEKGQAEEARLFPQLHSYLDEQVGCCLYEAGSRSLPDWFRTC